MGVLVANDVQWKQHPDGWFPAGWTSTYYDQFKSYKTLELSYRVRVMEFKLNPELDAKLFKTKLTPGMIVQNSMEEKLYRVGDDGKTLIDITHEEEAVPRRSQLWLLLPLGVLVVVIALYVYRSRSRPSAPNDVEVK